MKAAEISVIVLIGEKAFGLDRFLKSFLNTQPTEKIQVIFIYPEGFKFSFDQNEKFADVIHMAYGKNGYFAVIRKAIENAKADYVLFQESHTDLKMNIIDKFLQYIKTDKYACIGSLVYPGENMSFTDWVAYLGHYSDWGPGTKGGDDHRNVPGHNCVYKKSALLDLGNELDIYLYADSIIQWKFLEKGLKLFLIDEVFIIHDDKMTFRELLSENFWYGWIFSYARRRANNWNIFKRLLYSLLVFAKPLIRFRLLLKKPLKNYPISKSRIPAILAAILLNYYWNALGESFGVLFSDRIAIQKFSEAH
jgi:hypothetical protein